MTPYEQAALERHLAGQRKRAATLDRKARDAADNPIGRMLNAIIEQEKDFVVPRYWVIRGPVPEWVVGMLLREAIEVVGEAHQQAGLDRPALAGWFDAIELFLEGAIRVGIERAQMQAREEGREYGRRLARWLVELTPPPLPGQPPARVAPMPVQTPPEDEDALGALA